MIYIGESPKLRDTLTRMWNDLRYTYGFTVDEKKIKTKHDLIKAIAKVNTNYADYIKTVDKNYRVNLVRNIFDKKTKKVFYGGNSKFRKQLTNIKRKNIYIKETEKYYRVYGKNGKFLKKIKKDDV